MKSTFFKGVFISALASCLLLLAGCPSPSSEITSYSVEGIILSQSSASMLVGDTLEITASITPEEAANDSLLWESSAEAVVSVDESGMVAALSSGSAVISVSDSEGTVTVTCTITVRDQFTVSFDSHGGTEIDSITVIEGETIPVPASPEKSGWEFDGWYADEEYSDLWEFSTDRVSSDMSLHAKWRLPTYSVTFDCQGGSDIVEVDVTQDTPVSKPADPARNGYTFNGWYRESSCTTAFDFNDDITEDTTLYAGWDLVTYNIHYDLFNSTYTGNGLVSGGNYSTYTIESADIVLQDVESAGAIFLGWYMDEAFTEEITVIESGTYGDLTIYAKWTAARTISFDANGANGSMDPQVVGEGVPEALEPNAFEAPENMGFAGWSEDANATVADYADEAEFTAGASDVTLYALWMPMYTYELYEGGPGIILNGFTDAFSTTGTLTLPSTLDGHTVVAVSFRYADSSSKNAIIHLTLPDTITTLEYRAFYGCNYMQSLDLGNGISEVKNNAIYYCGSLSSVTIPDSLTYISEEMFAGCRNLSSIDFPSSLESIGYRAFHSTGLESISIPAAVTSISKAAFQYCNSLATITVDGANPNYKAEDNILFSKDGTVLYQFAQAKPDTSYTVPEGVTTIEQGAFGSSNLTSITLPTTLTTISSSGIFANLEDFTSITIPEGVTSLGGWSFSACHELESVELPSTLESIGQSCFLYCYSLESITLPAGITSITNYAFSDCRSLTSVTLEAVSPPAIGSFSNVFEEADEVAGFTLYVPAGSVETYKADAKWSEASDYIQPIPGS